MKENKILGLRYVIAALLLIIIVGFAVWKLCEPNTADIEVKDETLNRIIDFKGDLDFSGVVVAINTHKSIYLENETARIGIAVLDDEGNMVCDADITLEITDANGIMTVLKTPKDVIVTEACQVYDVTTIPDYYTDYKVNSIGIYHMNLTVFARGKRGSMEDTFTVAKNSDHEVIRDISLTRIFPSSLQKMNIRITANKDYTGIVTEYVPASFDIVPSAMLMETTVAETKILSWNVKLEKNDEINLIYEFHAPDISPAFYLLGRLRIGDWHENRYWQIVSDGLSVRGVTHEPTTDPNILLYNTYVLSCTMDIQGGGQSEYMYVCPEFCTGAGCPTFENITTSSTGLQSNVTNCYAVSHLMESGVTVDFLINGTAAGTYSHRCFAIEDDAGESSAASTPTDVTVLSPDFAANITINGLLNFDNIITYPENATVNGTCGGGADTCYLFGNISGTMELLASDNSEPFFVEYNSSLAAGLYNFTVNNTYNASGRSHTLKIEKASSSMQCFINGTRDDFGPYYYPFDVNVTANLTIPTTGIVNISVDGHINDSGASPYTNITNINSLGNFTANCSYEGNQNYSGGSESFWINTSNGLPKILNIAVDDPIDLIPGSATKVTCNATINDSNGFGDIGVINSTLYFNSTGVSAEDDNNNHYSNNSCMNVSKSGSQINVSCSYDVYYYANNGSWSCNITAIDSNNVFGSSAAGTTVNDLLAIDVSPSIIDYGEIEAGDNSSQDFKVNITNLGNIDFNVTLYGYAINDGDNLSMNCTEGYNISAGYHKYSIYQAWPYSSMINLSGNASLIANYTLPRRTNDTTYKSDRNYTYWKMGIPYGIQGRCAGFVIFTGVSI